MITRFMRPRALFCVSVALSAVFCESNWATTVRTPYGISYQVNVDATGNNIPGDAANEPSLCLDPTNPDHIAVGWRQFNTVTDSFRQSGLAYSTNGGLNWVFPGVLEPGTFRSDPVLASDATGVFYYLGVVFNTNDGSYHCDMWGSTNGGVDWQFRGLAEGGDKPWIAVDKTTGPGRGNIYQLWSPYYNFANDFNQIFTRSTDGGATWMPATTMANWPHFGTLDVGPNGEVYTLGVGTDETTFWVNRSTNAPDTNATLTFDLTSQVNLGGPYIFPAGINPVGLAGQAWLAVDRSTGPTRGNVYVLCSVTNDPGNMANVMLARSTNGGVTWSDPVRINDDSPTQHAWHWFGALAVAPNGRIDVCWNDTRNDPSNRLSQLYYSWSEDGGLTWAPNRALSPPFDSSVGYPMQEKMGDYIGMVSLNEYACIAYTATFNGEEDVYFVRAELPIRAMAAYNGKTVRISWNAVPGANYVVQAVSGSGTSWSSGTDIGSVVATNIVSTLEDPVVSGRPDRFYRVLRVP